jgi:group II intron reverse transcriptase/maturase
MGVERRGAGRRTGGRTTRNEEDSAVRGKAFEIPKELVWESYKQVKANRGSAGCDGQTMQQFDEYRDRNLYKIWNRLSSGSYLPPPVLRQEIPKLDGSVRVLGIPTVSDRIAQGAVKLFLERKLEGEFHADSYGYRPGRSAHDALEVTRQRCWRYPWVVEVDIRGFFDNVRHDLILRALAAHSPPSWVTLYVGRWLTAPMVDRAGNVLARRTGTPQGGVISPILANLFLHYGMDRWMERAFPCCPFERYADDTIVHCRSEREAERLLRSLNERMIEIGLELHPRKTRVVYVGRGVGPAGVAREFTFLGYDFKVRTLVDRKGQLFRRIAPGASKAAMKGMTRTIKGWRVHRSSGASIMALAQRHNATLRGWINYYGRFWYRNFSYRLWSVFQSRLAKWMCCKYRLSQRVAERKLARIRRDNPSLFAHWDLLRGSDARSRAV